MKASTRQPKLVPIFLIATGLVVIVLAGSLREVRTVTSRTTDVVSGRSIKVSTTEQPFVSDAMFVAAVALGGVLVLCGTFSRWIMEITLPGGAALKLQRREYWDQVAAVAGNSLEGDRPERFPNG